jgi:hypothetical protein
MRLIGTAIAAAAALTLVTAGAASAHHRHHHGMFKFCIQCPVISPVAGMTSTCAAAGKDREAARANCQMQHQLCYVGNYSAKTCK